ncbi:Hpt domain-containing protein [Zoogloea sp. LCSB751]|uniref:hybrid sensor histidine kinase/response regulator n=1 Tax=Zoogloea sp. LCSB751 TaxID=1965277 RepID=UPI0009A4C77E|nr:Hpt domain-containing protein [Zoogloea sp. LCSB751]
MSPAHELDLGPLTWVKGEIDLALGRAADALAEASSSPDRLGRIKFAQTHLHQAHGALSIVGLDGLTQFSDQLDRLLGELASQQIASTPEISQLAARCIAAIGNYLDELTRGQPDQALRLFDLYSELAAARGQETPTPSELFFPDLGQRPDFATPAIDSDDPKQLRSLRSRFERGLLKWFRTPHDPAGPQEMREAASGIESLQTVPAARAFWLACSAFFDALGLQGIAADAASKRLCGRIDAQMRRVLEGSGVVAERLMRDVLYQVAVSTAHSPTIDTIRAAYRLEHLIPAGRRSISGTPQAPLLGRLRSGLNEAKEAWNQFSKGSAIGLPHFQDAIAPLSEVAQAIDQPEVSTLFDELGATARWLRRDPLQLTDALSMDMATTMLLLEARLDNHQHSDDVSDAQLAQVVARLQAHQRGEKLSPLVIADSGDTQTRHLNRQLAHEILASLGDVEQNLDSFFRAPTRTDILAAVREPLKQIEGALSVLNEDAAVRLLQDAAARIRALSASEDVSANQEDFEEIAHRLSALGIYVEALQHGPADLERILHPDAEVQRPSTTSIEIELAQQRKETAALAAALKDNPDDFGLRTELQINLESLRQDASLTADTELEKQARQALSLLDAGALFNETPPIATTETPALSPEASRLMDASEEEIDAELLAIFIEEAIDVRAAIATNLARLEQEPSNTEVLTALRRSFHTLKGSGRMVGLKDFGEAAWGMEQTLNHWLRLELPVDGPLLHLIADGSQAFSAWIDQLEAGAGHQKDVSALLAEAARLRNETAPPPAAAPEPPEAARTQPDATPAEPQLTEISLDSAPQEVDLEASITLPELDFAATDLGESLTLAAAAHASAIETVDLNFPDLSFEEARAATKRAEAPPAEPLPASEASLAEAIAEEPAPTPVDFDLSFDLPVEEEVQALEAEAIESPDAATQEPLEELEILDIGEEPAAVPEPLAIEVLLSPEEEHAETAEPVAADTFEIPEAVETVEALDLDQIPPAEQAPTPETETETEEIVSGHPVETVLEEALPGKEDIEFATEALEELEEVEAPSAAPLPAEEQAIVQPETATGPDEIRLGEITLSRPLFDLYLAEARQHVATLRQELSRLPANPTQTPPTVSIRAAHTLSGISGTAHFSAPQQLAKALELAQQRLADLDQAPSAEQTEILIDTAAALESMVVQLGARVLPEPEPELIERLDAILASQLADFIGVPTETAPPELVTATLRPREEAPVRQLESSQPATPLRDDLDPELLPIFLDEGNELLDHLDTALRAWRAAPGETSHASGVARLLHTLKGSARMVGAMNLGQNLHDLETRLERARAQDPGGIAIVDEIEAALDQARQTLDTLQSGQATAPAQPAGEAPAEDIIPLPAGEAASPAARAQLRVDAGRIDQFVNEAGEISIARTRIEGELRTLRRSLLDLTENVIRLRNQLREVEIQADTQMQSRLSQVETQHTEFDPLEMDRYTRLQELTRMMAESVGDVTTVQQNLLRNLDGAESALHAQSRMARELQQSLMHVRMVPFDSLAERLYRLVRQTAKELGRRANLDIIGGQIEIDRSVLDAMSGPLAHLVRNAVAHGIETPEARREAGKTEIGQITLKIAHEGNEVLIEFRDDGAGLDFARIRQHAIDSGLIAADEDADDKRLTNLIFVPGFSTASLSSLAGRGVGMDVVKSETAAVGGRISVDTTPGEGTTFRIHLPLTLAVTQALLVRAGNRTFAIPSSMVAQVLELKAAALEKIRSDQGTDWLGEHYGYRYLPRLLGDQVSQPQVERFNWVLLLRAGSETLALHVDALRGNQEIVVKNAGPQYARMVGYSGATVLGDGEIVLILNPVALAGRSPDGDDDEAPLAVSSHTPSQPTVMVVDDSLTVRKITGRLLEREGYRVVTAKDGVDALEQLLTVTPDVVIADIEMPRMDGFDLTRNIRADARLKAVPIIMITSRTADKHKRYAEEIGVNHYLGKPYDEDVLLGLIHDFVATPA